MTGRYKAWTQLCSVRSLVFHNRDWVLSFLGLYPQENLVIIRESHLPVFLSHNLSAYLGRAFEFSRQFLYKWTVNWRFVDEETFLSKPFAYGLLITHILILLIFVQYRWIRPTADSIYAFIIKQLTVLLSDNESPEHEGAVPASVSSQIDPSFVMDAMLGSMVIGMLCARSRRSREVFLPALMTLTVKFVILLGA